MTTTVAVLSVLGAFCTILAFGFVMVRAFAKTARQTDVERLSSANDELRKELEDEKERRRQMVTLLTERDVAIKALQDDAKRKDAALVRIGEEALGTADLRALAEAVRELSVSDKEHDREAAARHAGTIRALREIKETIAEIHAAQKARMEDQ